MKSNCEMARTRAAGSSAGCVVRADKTMVLAPMMARLTPRVSCDRKRSPRICSSWKIEGSKVSKSRLPSCARHLLRLGGVVTSFRNRKRRRTHERGRDKVGNESSAPEGCDDRGRCEAVRGKVTELSDREHEKAGPPERGSLVQYEPPSKAQATSPHQLATKGAGARKRPSHEITCFSRRHIAAVQFQPERACL